MIGPRRYYCSYFDHRYVPRGLAMIRSLRRFRPGAEIWVLCLSDEAYAFLSAAQEPGVHALSVTELEASDSDLLMAKHDGRSTMSYYFSCTPALVRHVLRKADGADCVTYLDADLWFFGAPDHLYRDASDASVIIIPHRFPPALKQMEQFGLYNVGWVTFCNDAEGLKVLEWWRAHCIEWCEDYVDAEHDRFADQRYLNHFPAMSSAVHVVDNPGANLAPWNLAGHRLSLTGGRPMVDGNHSLLFFHFHGLKPLGRHFFLTNNEIYGARLDYVARNALYRPYLAELRRIEAEVAGRMPAAHHSPLRVLGGQHARSLSSLAKSIFKILRAIVLRSIVLAPR